MKKKGKWFYFTEVPGVCRYFVDKIDKCLSVINQEENDSVQMRLSLNCVKVSKCWIAEVPFNFAIQSAEDLVRYQDSLIERMSCDWLESVAEQIYLNGYKRKDKEVIVYFATMDECPKSGLPGLLFYWETK